MAIALYARVSTTRQADNELSIPDQLKQMRDWCHANGYSVGQEYVEPGASATDDRRAVFQQMMADAALSPAPYEAIVVHSQSRFFRDSIDFGLYERKLSKAGVKLISITQPNGDDTGSGLIRRMISVFDEYSSKENSKHTLRAMKENARQGFFNGSRAPFGYQVVATDVTGNRGRKKKRLAIHDTEAEVVRLIYDLYLHGLNGRSLGIKQITQHLNDQHISMRGHLWRIQKVHDLLSDEVYIGQFIFNRLDPRNKTIKPEAEWVRTKVEPIITEATFSQAQARRASRAPGKTSNRALSSPVLLTGLMRCGCCNSAMTTATGKSGRYRYYKCTSKMAVSTKACTTPNLPMEQTDRMVLNKLAEEVFTPKRITTMLQELRQRLRAMDSEEDQQLKILDKELKGTEQRLEKLYEAVETGALPLDSTLQARAQKHKANREVLLTRIAGLKRRKTLPLDDINPGLIEAFSRVLRNKLQDPASRFGRDYLNLLIKEIRVAGNQATVTGSHAAVAQAIAQMQMGTQMVPTFISDWRARRDSNSLPLGS
jgi:site-specific DNA recombinase